jgi:transposase
MSMSSDDHMSKAEIAPVRRIEVFTGAGRRREWTPDQKALIVAESYAGVGSVCDVARRHRLTPTQLFTWRRLDRRRQAAQGNAAQAAFVPAVVDRSIGDTRAPKRRRAPAEDESPLIGLEVKGASMWICRGADVATVMAIVKALKGGK